MSSIHSRTTSGIESAAGRLPLIASVAVLCLMQSPAFAQPSNDLCGDAEGPLDVPSLTPGTTVDSTFDDVGLCDTSNTDGGVWYSVIGTGNMMTATTCENQDPPGSANYDSKITVLCSCGGLECIGGNDDEEGCDMHATFSWCSELGVEYLILVHGFLLEPSTGDFELSVFDDGAGCGEPTFECDGDDIPAEGIGTSDCCIDNGAAGCSDSACQDAVCTGDPFCCDVEWDFMCADQTKELCPELCDPGPCTGGQTANCDDNCPSDANPDQEDVDGDGLGDVCDPDPNVPESDGDGDGVGDAGDVCPGGDDTIDTDGDGTPDDCDDTSAGQMTDCCGGGLPAVLPLMLLGWSWRRRNRRR